MDIVKDFSQRFKNKNEELRDYYKGFMKFDYEVRRTINELFEILHQEHADWSLNKIAFTIWIVNEDLDGFSKSRVIHNINEEHKALIVESKYDPTKNKEDRKKKQKNVTEEKVFESSSSNIKNDVAVVGDDELEKFRQQKGKIIQQQQEEEEEQQEGAPEILYDDPQKIIRQYEERIIELEKEIEGYEELKQKYEQVITSFEVRRTKVINNQELPLIIKVDPYKREITSIEIDQQEVKKLLNKVR